MGGPRFFIIAAFLTFRTAALLPASTAYVTNSSLNKVSVVDTAAGRVVGEIPVGIEPFGVTFSQDGTRAYVANAKSSTVSVIDTERQKVVETISLDTKLPAWIAAGGDGTYLCVGSEGSHKISVIATASNTVLGNIGTGRAPAGIAISQDGRFAYVANEGSGDVSVVDLQRAADIARIPAGAVPQGVAVNRDGGRVYVANFGDNSITVVDAVRRLSLREIPVAAGQGCLGIAVSPDAERLYVTNFKGGTLSLLSGTSAAGVPVGSEAFGVAMDPRGREVLVVNGKDSHLTVVGAADLGIRRKIRLEDRSYMLAVKPENRESVSRQDILFVVAIGILSALVICALTIPASRLLLAGIFVLALSLRLAGIGWGIPRYDPAVASAEPRIRTSYHFDEDNFLWDLTRLRPRSLDLYVPDFHWGTLQFYLIEAALLAGEHTRMIAKPWRDAFINFEPTQFARVFTAGRAVSALLGSLSVFPAFGIGRILGGQPMGISGALILSLLPLHVVNSHFLTSDISMLFFLLLAFYELLSTLDNPARNRFFRTGISFGLSVAAKYNALLFAPVILLGLHLRSTVNRSRKVWLYGGILAGFLAGEPYALLHHHEFFEALRKDYWSTVGLPRGAVPSLPGLMLIQARSVILYGLGLPLSAGLILGGLTLLIRRFLRRGLPEVMQAEQGKVRQSLYRWSLVWTSLICFTIGLACMRQPMIRYALPITVFLIFPAARLTVHTCGKPMGRAVACCLLLLTGVGAAAQVEILGEEHTANEAFRWIERNVPRGSSVTKGWPEIPILNPREFRVRNYYTGGRMVDFSDFFKGSDGGDSYPDYVLLDNLPTFAYPADILQNLASRYCLVADFKTVPRFSLPEWDAPHDWKYTHPEIRIYRRKIGN